MNFRHLYNIEKVEGRVPGIDCEETIRLTLQRLKNGKVRFGSVRNTVCNNGWEAREVRVGTVKKLKRT